MALVEWFGGFLACCSLFPLLKFFILIDLDIYELCPLRFFLAMLIPSLIVSRGRRKKSLSKSGAVAAFFMGFTVVAASLSYTAMLFTFFIIGSKATKYKAVYKKKIFDENSNEETEGNRDWKQVVANGGVCMGISICSLYAFGCSAERVVDFGRDYMGSYMDVAVLGALACAAGDTLSSELGAVLATGDPILITTLQRVPKGTNGGISFAGCAASVIGGIIVGLAHCVSIFLFSREEYGHQHLLILLGGIYGLLGSLLDSLLGATLQFSGYDENKKRVVESPGPGVETISGCDFLHANSVNLLSTLISALFAPSIALKLWNRIL